MIEVRGKFILLANSLMENDIIARDAANKMLLRSSGNTIEEVGVDDWYDSIIYQSFLDAYCYARAGEGKSKNEVLTSFAQSVFPTLDLLGEIPEEAKENPVELIKYSTLSFAEDHRGEGIRPIKIITESWPGKTGQGLRW